MCPSVFFCGKETSGISHCVPLQYSYQQYFVDNYVVFFHFIVAANDYSTNFVGSNYYNACIS